jgi:uncharacterized protein (UPF0276 family)
MSSPAPQLGVGLAYQNSLRPYIEASPDSFDYLEIVPDILWTDFGPGHDPRYVDDPEGTRFLDKVRGTKPIVPHSIGLSIGAAHRFEREHVHQMARWYDWLGFPWHSDHLAFAVADHGDGEVNIGTTLPLVHDHATLELVIQRVAEVRERIPVPFLLENNVQYFEIAEPEIAEPEFLNVLCERSGCGLVLDLHNVYTNSRNHGGDPLEFIEQLDLENVIELHVAGGMEMDGFYLDAHSGPLPAELWELLDAVLPRCPNVGGVTFELLGSWFAPMGPERLADELARLRQAWRAHVSAPVS